MLHQIGVGALGPVFRTYEPTRDRLVAVKVFRLDVIPEQARALADELGRAADAGLFHPSIVEPVAAGLEGTVAYRAEEYVAAESLDVAMRHYAPATLDKALPFITQLASAIDFARAAGVGHGALHPRDIFVTPDEARATGFGVVDAMDRLVLRAPVRRPYSPPERIAGQPWNTAADVFSLAAIAFELLTGRRPSGVGDDMGSLSGATLGDRADDVRTVLAKAMREKPSERYQTAQEFSSALAVAAGLAETQVSVAAGVAVVPAAAVEPEIVRASTDPLEPASELALTFGVPPTTADVELALKDTAGSLDVQEPLASQVEGDHALEDFAGDSDILSPSDSPREAARKAIAAREVRKRQHKKKVESVLFEAPREELAPPVVPAEAIAALPEVMPIPPPAEQPSEEPTTDSDDLRAKAGSHDNDFPAEVGRHVSPASRMSDDEKADEPADDLNPLRPAIVARPAIVSTDADIDLVAATDVPTDMPALEAVAFDRTERDLSDRVVAVDEFRAREAASTKSDRAWPRVPDRTPVERPAFERTDRSQSPSQGSGLNLSGSAIDQAPVALEAPPERQRVMMLPLALVAGLCLILGYAVGYIVRGRAVDVASVQTPAATAPTTGTSRPPSEGVVPPSSAPNIPSEPAPESAKPASTSPAPSPVAKSTAPPTVARPTGSNAPKTGRVVVNSSPAKAGVTVNGKWSGRTPLTLSDLKFGKYVIRVVEPGYEVERQQFTLSSGSASRNVDVTLKRTSQAQRTPAAPAKAPQAQAAEPSKPTATTAGSIYVDSRPQGARVFVDDKQLGVTPVTLNAQSAGSHVVRLELPDHNPRSETITVKPGATTRVTGSLERIR